MIGFTISIVDLLPSVKEAAKRATFRNVGHAAASIRKSAIEKILVSDDPSPPGSPPHTRRRQLRRAIVFFHDKAAQEAITGPRASVVGESASAHEFGGDYLGVDYPERAFMGPALEDNLDRFASDFAGSIGD